MWENDPMVLQLINYMVNRGCLVAKEPSTIQSLGYILFGYGGKTVRVEGEDLYNAINAAYRVEWDLHLIAKRFERYLIDLHNKRKFNEENGL